jgi:hypothetical protein
MATAHNADPVFYPAFCFKASPTHFAWVKMATADVHRLQRPRNFEGMDPLFHFLILFAFSGVLVLYPTCVVCWGGFMHTLV